MSESRSDQPTDPPSQPARPPRVLLLPFASLRSHSNQELYARGIPRMLAFDLNRAEPGVAAAAMLTARKEGVKGFVLPQAPSEPGPMVALGEALGVSWIVQGFSKVTREEADVQAQWVDVKNSRVSDVKRFTGSLAKVLDQARNVIAAGCNVGMAPSMPPPVWSQTKDHEALESFLLYLDNSTMLYDPSEQSFVGELRDPADCLRAALKHDRYFRAASDALANEDKSLLNSFGAVLEIDVDGSAML